MRKRTTPHVMAQRIVKLLKRERPDRVYLKAVFAHVREQLDLRGKARAPKRLPQLLTHSELERFYKAVWKVGNHQHMVMIKLLLFTGLRNAELAELRLDDIDIDACTVRVQSGKGRKDRCVPFPRSFRGELSQYLDNQRQKGARFLFETSRLDQYTTRWIRAIVKRYADKAGIEKRIYPHLFRHQLLTHLARKGLVDAKIQVISGHATRQNLEVYQELSLAEVADDYQDAMKDFPIDA